MTRVNILDVEAIYFRCVAAPCSALAQAGA
jgi:hypothetical protein